MMASMAGSRNLSPSCGMVEQDDTVAFLGYHNKAKLGVATKVYRDDMEEEDKHENLKEGEVVVDEFPGSVHSVVRRQEEILVLDRGFSLSESVTRVGSDDRIGFVKKIDVKADVIVLPERKIVAQNVDLREANFVEPFASGGQSFILYDDWIGTVLKTVFELTISFRNCFRCKIRDNIGASILYRRKDYGIGKQWVPGETVMVSTAYVLSKKVEWEPKAPPCLQKRKLRSYSHHTPFTIEKVSIYAVKVRWLTTPSASVTPPAEKIIAPNTERVVKLDKLEYTRAVCGDRMKMKADDSVVVRLKSDWEKALTKELVDSLSPEVLKGERRRRFKYRTSSSSSSCSTTHTSARSTPAKKRSCAHSDTDLANPEAAALSSSDSECSGGSGALCDQITRIVEQEETVTPMVEGVDTVRGTVTGQDSSTLRRTQESVESGEELKVGAEVEVVTSVPTVTTPTTPRAPSIPPGFVSNKRKKSTSYNVRQMRRNNCRRAIKRKTVHAPVQLDMFSGEEFYGDVVRTRSTFDVLWMDGTVETAIPGKELAPYVLDLDQHDHVPGAIVARKRCPEMEGEYGIVLSADIHKRMATVQWYSYDWKSANSVPVLANNELCSLFDLMLHPNYQRFWWGSLCLRMSKESTDVRNLIGQLIATNDSGKNTIVWFNGTTEDVWPVEVTVLLTNEDADDEADDDTWLSVDSDNESTDQELEEVSVFEPRMEVVRERMLAKNRAPLMRAKVVLPKELIESKMYKNEVNMKEKLEINSELCKEWVESMKGNTYKLSDVSKMLGDLNEDYNEGRIEYAETLARFHHVLVCLGRSTNNCESELVNAFYSWYDEVAKRTPQAENRSEQEKMRVSDLFRMARLIMHDAVSEQDVLMSLDPNVKWSSDSQKPSAGILFLEALVGKLIEKLELAFDKSLEITRDAAGFIKSPYFTASNIPSLIEPEDQIDWDTAEGDGEKRAGGSAKQEISVIAKELPHDEITEALRLLGAEHAYTTGGISTYQIGKGPDCELCLDSFEFVDVLLPELSSQWAFWLNRKQIKYGLYHFIGRFISMSRLKILDSDMRANHLMEVSEGLDDSESPEVKKTFMEECEALKEAPKYKDMTVLSDKLAYPIIASLSTTVLTLLHDVMCDSHSDGLYDEYASVEYSFRMIFSSYLKTLVGKEKLGSVWDESMDRLGERWYDTSVRLTKRVRGILLELFAQMIRRTKEKRPSPLMVAANGMEQGAAQGTEQLQEVLVLQDLHDIPMVDEEKKVEKETAKDKEEPESETIEQKSRRFPAVEFDNEAPAVHSFIAQPTGVARSLMRMMRKELDMLSEHLPDGIHVKAFEDRLDLLSLLIIGPKGTPFADVPFLFDVYLPPDYPAEPPRVHYWAFSQEQLNPNLYQNGKVCVSLLGTWNGKGSEQWTADSNLLQVFLSIQGLILVPEPYFNEAGYEARKNVTVAAERSRRYNEMALVNSLDYFCRIVRNPPKRFETIITEHCMSTLPALIERVSAWENDSTRPDFPLSPISEGCRLSLRKIIVILNKLQQDPVTEEDSAMEQDTQQTDDSTDPTTASS